MIRFNEDVFLDAAKQLVEADETERALALLNNLPAYYRDNKPESIKKLIAKINCNITLAYDLLHDSRELPKSNEWSHEFLNTTMRGVCLRNTVKEFNDNNIVPHIVDMGPGDFTFAIGLCIAKLNFTYECLTLNSEAKASAKEILLKHYVDDYIASCEGYASNTSIFVAYEIIEHLSNVDEIRYAFDRKCKVLPEYVLLSTPKYTFESGTPNWDKEGIHHLRAYTPNEFIAEAFRLFPEYSFNYADNPVMVLIGKLK
jgi:hypothetical protein